MIVLVEAFVLACGGMAALIVASLLLQWLFVTLGEKIFGGVEMSTNPNQQRKGGSK